MTPKEKAEELIEKFKCKPDCETNLEFAKHCALISINEILDLGYVTSEPSSFNVYNFYSKVKIEIKSL